MSVLNPMSLRAARKNVLDGFPMISASIPVANCDRMDRDSVNSIITPRVNHRNHPNPSQKFTYEPLTGKLEPLIKTEFLSLWLFCLAPDIQNVYKDKLNIHT